MNEIQPASIHTFEQIENITQTELKSKLDPRMQDSTFN